MAGELSGQGIHPISLEDARRIIASGDVSVIHAMIEAIVELNSDRIDASLAASQVAIERDDPMASFDELAG